ncbi:MAG: hypothetical protein J7485_05775 [Sphingobium sp.]|nr:hypothetical protein [Sphingobium sp.]
MGSLDKTFRSVRRETRCPTNFRAILHWDDTYAFVQVADIANNGFRLIGECLPYAGARVRIGAKGLNASGLVVWRTEQSCGAVLHEPINALRVVRHNTSALARRVQREPLDAIHIEVLAERVLDTFHTEDSAMAFLRGSRVDQTQAWTRSGSP